MAARTCHHRNRTIELSIRSRFERTRWLNSIFVRFKAESVNLAASKFAAIMSDVVSHLSQLYHAVPAKAQFARDTLIDNMRTFVIRLVQHLQRNPIKMVAVCQGSKRMYV